MPIPFWILCSICLPNLPSEHTCLICHQIPSRFLWGCSCCPFCHLYLPSFRLLPYLCQTLHRLHRARRPQYLIVPHPPAASRLQPHLQLRPDLLYFRIIYEVWAIFPVITHRILATFSNTCFSFIIRMSTWLREIRIQ